MGYWKDKRVIVTGGAGFLGKHVVEELKRVGCRDLFVPLHSDWNLTYDNDVDELLRTRQPVDVVIHLAAVVGGIGANQAQPGKFFYDNLIMGTLLMEYARLYNVGKFVSIGTVCSYPKYTPVPFKEENLWDGYPEETNAPYGLAKKMLLIQGQAYRQQYGFNSIYLIPVNLYGPGENFNLETSHVIPALIRKCLEGRNEVEVWGTGEATREFLYVEDAARAIVVAAELYNGNEPVNVGIGREIRIRDLVNLICKLTDFKGTVNWNTSKPDGQPRRKLDVSRAREYFGFEAQVELEEGLKRTIEWYKENY